MWCACATEETYLTDHHNVSKIFVSFCGFFVVIFLNPNQIFLLTIKYGRMAMQASFFASIEIYVFIQTFLVWLYNSLSWVQQ